jgi:hypothetical protein
MGRALERVQCPDMKAWQYSSLKSSKCIELGLAESRKFWEVETA